MASWVHGLAGNRGKAIISPARQRNLHFQGRGAALGERHCTRAAKPNLAALGSFLVPGIAGCDGPRKCVCFVIRPYTAGIVIVTGGPVG